MGRDNTRSLLKDYKDLHIKKEKAPKTKENAIILVNINVQWTSVDVHN